ncbi:GntR family transcriptional regulator [Domibacillus enclensis]|uniref:DNA-binding transcriptional regulator, GntR family n=1 Tax=Domibacillus enclensis TaxID=1017273 RepID=A0A1N6ZKP3_9BACI|nr:GntR family transcriptional regulator [Domibacillus enclensis]OXS76729.1 GntR family transcriptional regulator [Domibacillus enclensis]SIR27354.1 DNA-binding transcriptional regulator, GntR family [Domibacillus enclensis]
MDTHVSRGHSALSTKEQVYHLLKTRILNLQLTPGTSISEKEMSIEFNVSRTPVRESFLRLAQEGLLDIYPQKGTFVSLIDLNMVEEARFMREHLERAVVRIACEKLDQDHLFALDLNLSMQRLCIEQKDYKRMFELDQEFHRTIFEGCRKMNVWLVIQQMNSHFNRARMLRLATDLNWGVIFEQHTSIVEAIKQQNAESAESLMKEHLMMASVDRESLKKNYPGYFK